MLHFREANVNDIEVLASMNQQLIEDENSSNPMTLDQLKSRMLNWLESDWIIDLLYFNDSIIGYALFQYRQNQYTQEINEVYLRQYLIRREYRGRAFGTQGIRILKEQRFKDMRTISIDVLESNPRGMDFWKRAGFKPYYTNMRVEQNSDL